MNAVVPVFTAALLAFATGAAADAPRAVPERDKAVMLYFSKSFGSTQRQNRTPLAFGLRLQQSATFNPRLNIAMLDLRYSHGGGAQLDTFGLRAFGEGEDSSSSSSLRVFRGHPVRTGVVVGLGVLGLACATEIGICKSRGSRYETPAGTPTPGAG